MNKTYKELCELKTFKERYEYLKTTNTVGEDTFGSKRYLNQLLYKSQEWKSFRRKAIIRDNGCDLGISDREIEKPIIVHHINPITIEDILNKDPKVFDLDNVICCSHITHNAIHYGDENLLINEPIERKENDTCPWKK